jgi:hypothetical protein
MIHRTSMIHPETGETVSVSNKAVDEMIDRGYELADESVEQPEPKAEPKTEEE